MSLSPSSSLPSLMPDAEHHRLMRRLEHNARAREKACKLEGSLSVTTGIAKEQNRRERSDFVRTMQSTHKERVERWTRKTEGSPLDADLWAEDQKVFLINKSRDRSEMWEKKRAEKLQREAHQAITLRTLAEVDELELLRREKRQLVENEKQLRALKDVERTNGRCVKVLQQRKGRELERQQQQLERAVSVPRF
mmetsp:Transcript_126094/g.392549  ORF Transcript_126094/g.392549 Transcript_126094/m.392549 type:complete len:194 (-) Transcript_126094:66-647(-)